MTKKIDDIIALSAQLIDLDGNVPDKIKLLPHGTFRAKDGRPHELSSGWKVSAESAQAIITLASSQKDKFVVDYDHNTLHVLEHGNKAPAAGWYSNLHFVDSDGIYADVEWTDAGAAAISSKEYRYISPVITANKKTGVVTSIRMAALVNEPALDGLNDLSAMAAKYFKINTNQEALSMDIEQLLESLRWMFNLPTLATVDEIKAEIDKLKAHLESKNNTTEAAAYSGIFASFEQLESALSAKDAEAVELAAKTFDADKFVEVEKFNALSIELAAIKDAAEAERKAVEIDKIVTEALADGRLMQTQKEWAVDLGKTNIESLSTFLSLSSPVPGMQTKGNQIGDDDDVPMSSMHVPEGAAVDAGSVELHSKVTAYAKQHGLDFTTALLQYSK